MALTATWQQGTEQLLKLAWITGTTGAGYTEPPLQALGEVTELKLYDSAWTVALLRQAGLHPDPNEARAVSTWARRLPQYNFHIAGGNPPLYNMYLYTLLQNSLGAPVDRTACLRVLDTLRQSNGLYAWEPGGQPELSATAMATELAVMLGADAKRMDPTRKAVQEDLSGQFWQEASDARQAVLDVGGPLLLSAHNLGVPLDGRVSDFVLQWDRKLQNPMDTDPLTVEILLQLEKLNEIVGRKLALSPKYIARLQSLRKSNGGFSPEPGLEMELQYTYKIQELLLAVAGIHPNPEAAERAVGRFWLDSWVGYRVAEPSVVDTYYGLLVARRLKYAVPNEPAVDAFLAARIEEVIARTPRPDQLSTDVVELDYALRGRKLLTHPQPLPEGTTRWIEDAINEAERLGATGDVGTLALRAEAASETGASVDRGRMAAILRKADYVREGSLYAAMMLAEASRALDLSPDVLRSHAAVQSVLEAEPRDGGYLASADASVPDLTSTYEAMKALEFFAPEQAARLAGSVRKFVESLRYPAGGFIGTIGEPARLRSTAEALELLELEGGNCGGRC